MDRPDVYLPALYVNQLLAIAVDLQQAAYAAGYVVNAGQEDEYDRDAAERYCRDVQAGAANLVASLLARLPPPEWHSNGALDWLRETGDLPPVEVS